MFRLRPSREWQNKSAGITGKMPTSFASQLMALLGLNKGPKTTPKRRASDALGLRLAAAASPLAALRLLLSRKDPRLLASLRHETEAGRRIEALDSDVNNLTATMEQNEKLLLGLQAQMSACENALGLQKHSEAAFAHVDQEMARWQLRASELERAAIRPDASPGLFASSNTPAQRLRRWLHLAGQAGPTVTASNRMASLQQRMVLPSPRQLPARTNTLPLRDLLNLLARPRIQAQPGAGLMAQVHHRLEDMAQELYQYRHEKGASAEGRTERRKKNRAAGIDAPTLKPKIRQDEKA